MNGALSELQRSVTRKVAESSTVALSASAFAPSKRHPGATSAIELGQAHTTFMTFVCLDLTQFTRRTFWESHTSVVSLGDAVVGGFADVIHAFGGYVLGLRGDGLIAGFEGTSVESKAVALVATASALQTVEGPVNAWLADQGRDGLKAKAGIDSGKVSFLPVAGTNDYNMLGFALNFAAKCEKTSGAWEVVAGENYGSAFEGTTCFNQHPESPKTYTLQGASKSYRFFDVSWRPFLSDANGMLDDIRARPLEQVLA